MSKDNGTIVIVLFIISFILNYIFKKIPKDWKIMKLIAELGTIITYTGTAITFIGYIFPSPHLPFSGDDHKESSQSDIETTEYEEQHTNSNDIEFDLNEDGVIDGDDEKILINIIITKRDNPSKEDIEKYDLNKNGKLDLYDVPILEKHFTPEKYLNGED